jgi:hypothetical protein
MTLKEKYTEMRNAIDSIDLALHGIDHIEELKTVWEGARDDLLIKIEMDLLTFRQICSAMDECNRIINSSDFLPLSTSMSPT